MKFIKSGILISGLSAALITGSLTQCYAESKTDLLMKDYISYYQSGSFDKAMQAAEDYEQEVARKFGKKHWAIGQADNMAAQVYIQKGEFSAARKSYRKALKRFKSCKEEACKKMADEASQNIDLLSDKQFT